MKIRTIEARKPLFKPRLKVAAYARVSMESERLANSLSNQVSYYNEYIQNNPDWEFAGIYADSFITGTNAKLRPELQRMIKDCEDGKIDMVLCKSISRLARSTIDLLDITRHLKELGISVRFEKERLDTLSSEGELMLTLLAEFAAQESKSASSRIKWTIRNKFAEGKQWHTAAFGYRWNGETFIVQEEEAVIIRKIYELFLQDTPIKRIQRWVHENGYPEKSHTWVVYVLQNEVYKGDVILQKYFTPDYKYHLSEKNEGELPMFIIEDNHEAIVSREVFEAVQEKIQKNRASNPVANRIVKTSCFSEKIYCCRCGNHYTKGMTKTAKADGLQESWVCYGKIKHKKKFCPSLSIRGDRLREAARTALMLDEFDEEVFTEKIEKIVTTEGEALEFYFYDGTVREVPIELFRKDHMRTRDPHSRVFGYMWTLNGYVPDPERAEGARLMYEYYADGMSLSDISRTLLAAGFKSFRGKLDNRVVTAVLDSNMYVGDRTLKARYSGTGKDELVVDDHEAIVSRELDAKVKARRAVELKKQERRLATIRAKKEKEQLNGRKED